MNAGNRLAWLDGLRAIAVALVLLGHAKLAFQRPPDGMVGILLRIFNAHVGVQIFFVISGFIITLLLLREREASGYISLKSFWRRRAFRILPALWCFLLVLACLQLLGVLSIPLQTWLSSLFFYRNHVGEGWFTGHLWSLGVEAQFYLLWPIIVVYTPLAGLYNVLAAGVLIALVSRFTAALLHMPELSFYSLLGNLDLLLLGAMAATHVVIRRGRAAIQVRSTWHVKLTMKYILPALAVVTLMLAFMMSTRWSAWAMVAEPLLVGMLASLGITQIHENDEGILKKIFGYGPLSFLGLWSYSLYLWQQLFLAPVDPWPINTWMNTTTFAMPLCLFAVTLASYYLIERTFNRLGHNKRDLAKNTAYFR